MPLLYFAYGSNLLTHRLSARCASARALGRAILPGHRVDFAKLGWMDGSGKATILRHDQGRAEGVLYAMEASDLTRLDAIEGVGKGYERLDALPIEHEGKSLSACSYIATAPDTSRRPFDWYLALVLAGALEHGLSDTFLGFLRATEHQPDPEPKRPSRSAALEALAAAGHADLGTLLANHSAGAASNSSS